MPGDLFVKWLKASKPQDGVSVYTEQPGARPLGLAALKKLILDHFVEKQPLRKRAVRNRGNYCQ